jgi:hypothetical protein
VKRRKQQIIDPVSKIEEQVETRPVSITFGMGVPEGCKWESNGKTPVEAGTWLTDRKVISRRIARSRINLFIRTPIGVFNVMMADHFHHSFINSLPIPEYELTKTVNLLANRL